MTFAPDVPYNSLPFLPPDINLETPKIWKACNAANKSLARLREACRLIPNPDILISSIPLLEAASSSEIENIFTTQDSLYRVLATNTETANPAEKEVLNYRKALYTGYAALKEQHSINEELLETICSTILKTDMSRRDVTVYIGNRMTRVYTPPNDPYVLQALMAQLEEYINNGTEPDPLIRLALIHYQFEAIHPFTDGNGRTGRILNILYLVANNLLDIPVLYLSRYIIQNKTEYYKLLREATAENNFEEWICFILDAVEQTADWTYTKVHAIYQLMEDTRNFCREKLPNHIYSHELIDLIFLQPYCKGKYLVDAGMGNRQTAMKYLKELEKIGILTAQKISREVIYINTALYQILKE